MDIIIIDYEAGNIQSLQFALQRLGVTARLSSSIETITQADKIIFPGVGEASSAMKNLKEKNLHTIIPVLKQPVLGICLGMQLMCTHTEENNTLGLNIFNTRVKRFPNTVKVPQIGWNTIFKTKTELFKKSNENDYMYFVHSFYAECNTETIAYTKYHNEYASALQKNNFYGVQFHPEKSSTAGAQILQNFLNL